MKSVHQFVAVAAIAALPACSTVMTTPDSGYLSDYSALAEAPDAASAKRASAEIIDPAQTSVPVDHGRDVAVAYNKDQWISSFEDQLTILRPHLTLRVLNTMSLAAWHSRGRKNEDPIAAAKAESTAMDARKHTPPK